MDRKPEEIQRAAKVFKALSHPSRLEIACRLSSDGPSTQRDLISELGWPQSTMARHLAPLRQMDMVEGKRQGPEVLLQVSSELISQLVQTVCDWMHEDEVTEQPPTEEQV